MCGWPGVEKFFTLYCVFEQVPLLGDKMAKIFQLLNYGVNITWSHHVASPSLAQLVERRTVVVQIILRSLVRIRQLGNCFFFFHFTLFLLFFIITGFKK